MTGNHNRVRARGADLFYFSPAIEDSFRVISGGQGATAAAATELIPSVGVQVHPVLDTMIKDPARFFIVAVAEFFFSIAGIVAGIMIGGHPLESGTIQPDSSLRDIFDQQVENRKGSETL